MTPFLKSRMSGAAPLETVFWRDMLGVGTLINLAATAAALALFAAGSAPGLALGVNFLPIPWNLFLVLAVWRSAAREGGPAAVTARVVAAVWLIAMVVL